MIASSVWSLLVLAVGLQHLPGSYSNEVSESEQESQTSQPSAPSTGAGPLFLTPYINQCEYWNARELSKVDYFNYLLPNLTAHSGYITVKDTKNNESNLFFFFVEAEGNSSDAPLLLWTQGGPGLSALFGFFLENGPVGFSFNQTLHPVFYPRTNTLQKNMSVIYLDLPVGAGFSYTNETTAYPKHLEEISLHVMQFLQQFLQVFSEYQGRYLYLAGESYGARYSVASAYMMLQKEQENTVPMQLAGVIGGNGFLGPILETADSSDFLYQVSMLTSDGRNEFSRAFQEMKVLLPYAASNYTIAEYLLYKLFSTIFTNTPPTLFQNLTLYDDHASPFYTKRPLQMLLCYGFLNNTAAFKKAIHVGENASFQYNNPTLLYTFAGDWLRDIRNMTQEVLERIRVLLYLGQMDALFPSVKQRAHIANLSWSQSEAYRNATRELWKPPTWGPYSGHAAYLKEVTNFTEAVVLGMSHFGAADKPDEVYHLVMKFLTTAPLGLAPTAAS